jgi:preprotein translocase subunit SecD
MSRRAALIMLIITLVVAWGSAIVTQLTGVRPLLGLDLQGGFSVLLEAPEDTDAEVLDLAVEVIRRRIEALGGVQEPEVAVAGPRAIEVQLPGVTDRQRALDAVGTTGQLAFRPVLEANSFGVSPLVIDAQEYADSTTTTTTTTTVPGETTTTGADEGTTTTSSTTTTTTTVPPEPLDLTPVLPAGISICDPGQALDGQPGCVDGETGLTLSDDPEREAWFRDPDTGEMFHVGPARVLGSDLSDAQAAFIQQGAGGAGVPWGVSTGGVGQWVVSLEFNSEGADKFQEVTKELAGYSVGDDRRRFAIVLDGDVQSAPQMDEDITPETGIPGGRAVITMGGSGNPEQASRDLAVVLRYGALPVAFEQASVQSISATLGSDSLQAGLLAGAIGLGLVAIAMLLYYRVLGLVNLIGLTVFGSLVLVVISLLGETQGVTLTLAGVAGVIVSIGITADSYILYFERIKEEVRQGRSLRAAIDQGFTASFRTILTANTVALAAAVLLFMLAVGAVKGFALALGIATVVNVIVAQVFTRPAVALLGLSWLGEGGRFSIRGAAGTAREVAE